MVLFNFTPESKLDQWLVVNDDVMGGRSQASFTLTNKGTALFTGKVSLENNGGFSSIRYQAGRTEIEGFSTLVLRIKGDGKRYQIRIREKASDYFSYIAYFETSGEWETHKLPLQSMYPSFRGRKLDSPNFSGNILTEVSILIGNQRAEPFALEIDKITLE